MTCKTALLKTIALCVSPIILVTATYASAQTPANDADAAPKLVIPSAGRVSPESTGLMVGSPPAPDKRITRENATEPKKLRWSMQNVQKLQPVARIWRGSQQARPLPRKEINLDALKIPKSAIGPTTLDHYLEISGTDALIVLHRGRVVHERYYAGMQPYQWHAINSGSKSFVGLIVGELIAEGKIDPQAMAKTYVPELTGSALGDAKINELQDMVLQYQFGEGAAHTLGLQTAALQAIGTLPRPKDYQGPNGIYELLPTSRSIGQSGKEFRYDNGNTETLAWVVNRVTGKDIATLVSDRIWRPMGAESDAMISLDAVGTPISSGGIIATAMDLARFGELVRNNGKANGLQILNREMIASLFKGGSREAFAGSQNARFLSNHSYRNQWWVRHDGAGAIYARGQFGQTIYVSPAAELVIVQLASYPAPGRGDAPVQFAAYDAIAAYLVKR